MRIKKVKIRNFKCYKDFEIELNPCLNILVGNNEAGKSTILEALHLALSGIFQGKYLRNDLNQYIFNKEIENRYIESIKAGSPEIPPEIIIEIYFDGVFETDILKGTNNSERLDCLGVCFKIEFDDDYTEEYNQIIAAKTITTIPIEYYKITITSFARELVTTRTIPIKSVLIDSSSSRFQNSSDIYIAKIVKDELDEDEKVKLTQAYRNLKESFRSDPAIAAINSKITTKSKISDKKVEISVDLSARNSWETILMTYLDEIPFHYIGKGEQCIIKTNLALEHKKAKEANIILLEEPENHLSHSKLNQFVASIEKDHCSKQILISTHSSFVANKLGLENLLLLNDGKVAKLSELDSGTKKFFSKLPGYQTLRLILCKKAILVEGDSDELIVQKAYMDKHSGRLPIQDGIDVISVKLTFKRFLEIGAKIDKQVAVVTDNDGDYDTKIINKYKCYTNVPSIKIFADTRNTFNTLEPQFLDANSTGIEKICKLLGRDESKLLEWMLNNKAEWALRVFESEEKYAFPDYINRVIDWCDE